MLLLASSTAQMRERGGRRAWTAAAACVLQHALPRGPPSVARPLLVVAPTPLLAPCRGLEDAHNWLEAPVWYSVCNSFDYGVSGGAACCWYRWYCWRRGGHELLQTLGWLRWLRGERFSRVHAPGVWRKSGRTSCQFSLLLLLV